MGAPTPVLYTILHEASHECTSMETPQPHFMIVLEAFLGNFSDQEMSPTWERRSIVHHRQRLFWVGWALQVRHRRYGDCFDGSAKHQQHLPLASSYTKQFYHFISFFVGQYPSILALISFCNTEVNHTCFDDTVKYYQPPHNFHPFCTLEISLCKMPFSWRYSISSIAQEHPRSISTPTHFW